MAGLNEGDVINVRIQGTLFDQQIITTFYYLITTPSVTLDVVTACDSWAGKWKAGTVSPFLAFLNCCSPEYNADWVYVQKISPTRYVPGGNNVNLPGTNANNTDSPNQAAVITRAGMLSGRAFVGSIHIPGLSAGNFTNGKVTGPYLTLMSTVGSRMLNDFTDTTEGTVGRPVLYHYRKVPLAPVPPTALYRTIPQQTIRVMRRRTIGVGK